jgi:hypothetical protein
MAQDLRYVTKFLITLIVQEGCIMLSQHEKGFDSAEHDALGDVTLPGLPVGFNQFTLTNGAKLSFGDIIALAGDYYGVPEKPISLGSSDQDLANRFLAAYGTLANDDVTNVMNLLKMIRNQRDAVDIALQQGTSASGALNDLTTKDVVEAEEYTKGRYLELADRNLDHFNNEAITVHRIGHQLAMQAAIEARQIVDAAEKLKKLIYAYSLEAYSCHFLTDHFATGHIRTPRAKLEKKFDPVIGSLLSLFQHNEDGDNGLEVVDKKGNKWKAYGDGHLFEPECQETKTRALECVQTAVNEIYQAFTTGNIVTPAESKIYDLIPEATDNNYSAMFQVDAHGNISYRADLNDRNCNQYKALTALSVLEILDHFADQYVDDSIVQGKIVSIRKSLSADETKVRNCMSGLLNLSIFKQSQGSSADKAANKSKPDRNCSCNIL